MVSGRGSEVTALPYRPGSQVLLEEQTGNWFPTQNRGGPEWVGPWNPADLGDGAGSHTFQVISGCDVDSNGRLLRGYERFGYDGRDYIYLNEDLRTWTTVDRKVQITREQLEQAGEAERYRTYLERECMELLRRYLEKGNATRRAGEGPREALRSALVVGLHPEDKETPQLGSCMPLPLLVFNFFKKLLHKRF